jgi:hypothetical protein
MKIDKFLFSIIISIIFLSFFTYWHLKRVTQNLPKIEIPKIEIPKPETFLQPKAEPKEFISPDGKLKFRYSSDWVEIPGEEWQETISSEAKILFFSTKFKIEKGAFASLVVQEVNWEKELKEFIEEMKRRAKERGGEIEILNLEIKEREANLKARYKKERANFISREKIIFGEKKIYLISVFSFERFWPEFENEAEEILNSAQLVF